MQTCMHARARWAQGFKEVFLTPEHLAIAMEFAAGGELFDRIVAAQRFSEDVARWAGRGGGCFGLVERARDRQMESMRCR